ncbi:uncharacterized protein LOC103503195 [Cucumis melo]|uniref:Uncharacterized protein LOC103503195 n=1 Tax=Cucumis melo TaxID=3656 RepID=A0A1S3CQM0_CUCME|nr:uncharacterized protein LOC103503195 [Cucumis melo]
MGLRPEYESVRAALLHRSPLPSLDAAIQEILFEEKRLGINLSKHSEAVLANTYSPPGASNTFCKNCNRWLLDSGCCNHMTSNYSLMNIPSPTKSLPPIYAADGNCMNITHMGTINTPSLNLPHTYCIPNLTFNLVSVDQLFRIHRRDRRLGRDKVGRLFELLSLQVPPPSISALVTDSDTYQWHLRLGHASSEKLRHLISINN